MAMTCLSLFHNSSLERKPSELAVKHLVKQMSVDSLWSITTVIIITLLTTDLFIRPAPCNELLGLDQGNNIL